MVHIDSVPNQYRASWRDTNTGRSPTYIRSEMTKWKASKIKSHTGLRSPSSRSSCAGVSDPADQPPDDMSVLRAAVRSPAYPKTSAICGVSRCWPLSQRALASPSSAPPGRCILCHPIPNALADLSLKLSSTTSLSATSGHESPT